MVCIDVLIKSFEFSKEVQQIHFNDLYMDSDKYPKGLFKGSFSNCTTLNLAHDGEYKVEISGYLTIHGVTSPIISQASIVVKSGAVSVGGSFEIPIADYGIDIPKLFLKNIADIVKVTVSAELLPLK